MVICIFLGICIATPKEIKNIIGKDYEHLLWTFIDHSDVTVVAMSSATLPGSSVHGISQARILRGLPFPAPDLPDPVIKPTSPALAGRFFTTEPPENPYLLLYHFLNLF